MKLLKKIELWWKFNGRYMHNEFASGYPRQYKRVLSGEVNRFKRDIEDTSDKKLIAMEIAHENHERCRKLIFKIMEREIEGWWD
jgi:hypothetical protein